MIVTCKHCATRFKLDDKRVKPSGVKVRCSHCKRVYRVYPSSSQSVNEAAVRAKAGSGKPSLGIGGRLTGSKPGGISEDDDLDLDATEFSDFEKMLAIPPESEAPIQDREPGSSMNVPLELDLSDLEIEPEAREMEDLDLDSQTGSGGAAVRSGGDEFFGQDALDLDVPDLEVEVVSGSTPPGGREVQGTFDPQEPGAPGLELEDADIDAELSDMDLETFDLLTDDPPLDAGKQHAAHVSFPDEDLDDLDPAEIEALLDLEGPLEPSAADDDDPEVVGTAIDSVDEPEAAGREDEFSGLEAADDPAEEPGRMDGGMGWGDEAPLDFPMDSIGDQASISSSDGEEELDFTLLEKMITQEDNALASTSLGPVADEAPGPQAPPIDDLDLSTLDALLDQEIAADAEERAALSGEAIPDEPDLDLDSDMAPVDEGLEAREKGGGLIEDSFDFLDLERALDEEPPETADDGEGVELEAEPGAFKGVEEDLSEIDDEDALDFSDIEKLLEEEVDAADIREEELAQELELELDFDLAEDMPGVELEAAPAVDGLQEAEDEKAPAAKKTPAPELAEDLGLELELENIPEEFGGASVILDGEDGLELETLANYEDLETVAAEAIDRLNITGRKPSEVSANTFEMGTPDDDVLLAAELSAATGAAKSRAKGRSGVRAPLLILLILALIGGGGYAAYTLLDGTDIQLPFVDRFFKHKTRDAGDLYNIQMMDVQSRFLTNSTSGTLLIVSGRVKNAYDHPRSYIQVKGTLSAQDGRPLKTLTVYCGNVIADKELETLDMAGIGKRMSRRAGLSRSNIKVPVGRSVPFMLVFSDLPADLGEFAVEPAGSVSAK